jgi:2-hydroxychromene-2-carboxylate isomerase
MTKALEFFYDFRSPYSYLAFTQLREMDIGITLRPIMILKVMEAVGNVPTTITCAAKGRYARTDLLKA